MIERLQEQSEAREEVIAIVVFMAFAVEGYLNFLGSDIVRFWAEIERISWRKKIEVIHLATLNKQADWSSQELAFAEKLFKLRDRLAHGKHELVRHGPFGSREDAQALLDRFGQQPEWYLRLDRAWILGTAVPSFEALMSYLGRLAADDPDGHRTIAMLGGVVEEPDQQGP
jgi:hypothetical protein